jgi:crotonobetainyl-CoA:carnitine CoA-transferase CaiB-like acyl-CoA transferase
MNAPVNERLPLAGIRVLDFGQIYAVPYMGGHLADLGAEVIKIEAPHRADSRRTAEGVVQGTFQVLNRSKRSLALDLSSDKAKELFKKLVAVSDVVIENFTPRVMRNWGLHWEELAKVNKGIIMLSNCGYGATGPWGPLPIQGTSLEGTIGIINYTGYPDMPSKVGQSYPDFLASWTGLMAILVALQHREKTGEGQWIDQGMYQIGVTFLPEPILQYQIDGTDYERIANHHRWKAPHAAYKARGEDEWLAISIDSDEGWQRLARIIGRGDLAGDERFATVSARHENQDELDGIVGEWAAQQEPEAAMKLLQAEGIAAAPVFNAEDLQFNEHLMARKFYDRVDYSEDYGDDIGIRPLIGRPYKMSNTDIHIRRPAPNIGEANRYVLKDILGLEDSEIEELYAEKVIADEPTNMRGGGALAAIRVGTTGNFDTDFLEKVQRAYGAASRPEAVTEATTK